MKKHVFLSFLAFSSITLSGCYVNLGFIKFGKKPQEQEEQKKDDEQQQSKDIPAYDEEKQNARILEYYASIDSTQSGETFLTALRTLNLANRKKEVGYNQMGTSASGMYKYTDYDPSTAKYTTEGVPYGTKIVSFYSGKITTTFNREHTWPDSRGGDKVEDDILMTRPTISAENSDRGNSVYMTGMVDERNGWDPVAAFENNIGVYKSIRGECARIIFYCMTATTGLVLNDNTSQNGNNMGKITDLIEWACENPVNDREKRRNVGAEHLQGNRNAFVDHPEYACKIWGNTNAATRAACSKANYATN